MKILRGRLSAMFVGTLALMVGISPAVSAETEANRKTDLVLVCEEKNYQLSVNRLYEAEMRYAENRNKAVNRPYILIKYIGGKLSFSNNGSSLLVEDIPGQPNKLGMVGDIEITPDRIVFMRKRISGTETVTTIDRYTGFYNSNTHFQGELHYSASGKCETSKGRKF